ncbi:hypothetical protein HQ535_04460 [bacterium]|nr:hypothetical protein [bacterium]
MLIWIGWAIALLAGLLLGWGWHAWQKPSDTRQDWKTRLATRDEDVRAAHAEVAQVTIKLHQVTGELDAARSGSSEDPPEDDVRLEALEAELAEAERQISEMMAGAPTRSTDSELEHKIELLEVELTELASHTCPDPSAHSNAPASPKPAIGADAGLDLSNVVRLQRVRPTSSSNPVAAAESFPALTADDLTLIPGIDDSVEIVLAGMGVSTYRDVAMLDDNSASVIKDLLDGVIVNRDEWSKRAISLHEEHYGESI